MTSDTPLFNADPPLSPGTTVVMALLVIVASLIASVIPAQRAAGIHPVVALREE